MKFIWFLIKFHFFYLNLLEFSFIFFVLFFTSYDVFPLFFTGALDHKRFLISHHRFPIKIMLTASVKQQMTTCTQVIGNSSAL